MCSQAYLSEMLGSFKFHESVEQVLAVGNEAVVCHQDCVMIAQVRLKAGSYFVGFP